MRSFYCLSAAWHISFDKILINMLTFPASRSDFSRYCPLFFCFFFTFRAVHSDYWAPIVKYMYSKNKSYVETASAQCISENESWVLCREYLMYEPGSPAVVWFGLIWLLSSPLTSPLTSPLISPVSKVSLFLSFPVCRSSSLLTRGGGGGGSQIIRRQKNLVICNPFNFSLVVCNCRGVSLLALRKKERCCVWVRVRPHFRFGGEIWNWSENFVSLGSEKKNLISHDSLRCETPIIWSENEGKISEN
jgi:hypothetical protein